MRLRRLLLLALAGAPAHLCAQAPLALDQIDSLVVVGQAEQARGALTSWWDKATKQRPDRAQMQHAVWLRAVLTVDPAQASIDYQRLVVEYPGGVYSDRALYRLAQAADARGDQVKARDHLRALLRDYPSSPTRLDAGRLLQTIEPAAEAQLAQGVAPARVVAAAPAPGVAAEPAKVSAPPATTTEPAKPAAAEPARPTAAEPTRPTTAPTKPTTSEPAKPTTAAPAKPPPSEPNRPAPMPTAPAPKPAEPVTNPPSSRASTPSAAPSAATKSEAPKSAPAPAAAAPKPAPPKPASTPPVSRPSGASSAPTRDSVTSSRAVDGSWTVQLGAFASLERARALADRAKAAGSEVRLVMVAPSRLIRVRTGRFLSQGSAERLRALFAADGLEATVASDADKEEILK